MTTQRGPQPPNGPEKKKPLGVAAPLIFSAVLGLIGGVVVTLASTGGLNNPDRPLRLDLGLIAFGVFFIVSLLVVSLLQLASRDNPEHLSEGSGINRSSEQMHREAMAKARAKKRAEAERAEAQRSPASHPSDSTPQHAEDADREDPQHGEGRSS
ncbi:MULTISPECIES: hypothetical protein [Auritidibacter]|uniref:hypothetical protein n=1 Tax=Auritidibacter TaxID=1160973 RepID=UPI0015D5EF6C|nr:MULTISPECIES: hypothetical protein [Auritidibacter]